MISILSMRSPRLTGLRHVYLLHLDVEVGTLIDNNAGLAFLGDLFRHGWKWFTVCFLEGRVVWSEWRGEGGGKPENETAKGKLLYLFSRRHPLLDWPLLYLARIHSPSPVIRSSGSPRNLSRADSRNAGSSGIEMGWLENSGVDQAPLVTPRS